MRAKLRNKQRGSKLLRVTTTYGEVILDTHTGKYWHLNGSAAHIFDVLDKGGTEEDAIASLVSNYGVEGERARDDVLNFKKLATEGGIL